MHISFEKECQETFSSFEVVQTLWPRAQSLSPYTLKQDTSSHNTIGYVRIWARGTKNFLHLAVYEACTNISSNKPILSVGFHNSSSSQILISQMQFSVRYIFCLVVAFVFKLYSFVSVQNQLQREAAVDSLVPTNIFLCKTHCGTAPDEIPWQNHTLYKNTSQTSGHLHEKLLRRYANMESVNALTQ